MGNMFYGNAIGRIAQAMDWSVGRHRLISSNISNRDTPGYLARDLNFQKLMESVSGKTGMGMERTNPAHIIPYDMVSTPSISLKETGARLDGNTVVISEEMGRLVENSYLYQGMARFVTHKFNLIKQAIQGG